MSSGQVGALIFLLLVVQYLLVILRSCKSISLHYSLTSADVLKSLNVCDLGAFGLFTIYSGCSFLLIFKSNILECL